MAITGIPFIQLNMHKAFEASVELNKLLLKTPTITLLTEPCTSFNKVCYVPQNYAAFPNVTLKERPRTAVFIPRSIPHIFVEQLSNKDCTVVLVDTLCGRIIIASIYLDSNLPVVQEWLTDLVQYADTKHYPLLLSFDCNAHSELYGPDTNERGVDFEEFIVQHNLFIENKGNTPTFHAFRRGSSIDTYIDVTLTKGMVPLHNWRVHDMEYNGSDHHTISWTLPLELPTRPMIRPWIKAKWDVFSAKIAEYDFQLPESLDQYKTDRLLNRWYKVVNEALDLACPKRKAKPSPTELDWYGEEQTYLHNRTKRKYRSYKLLTNPAKRKAFVKAKRAYRRSCRRSRKRAWRIFVEKTPDQSGMATLFKIAQRRDRRSINTLRRSDRSLTEPGIETIKELTDAHFPAAQQGKHEIQRDSTVKIPVSELDTRYNSWINPLLVRKALRKFKPNKAAGPDQLKPIVLHHLPDNAIQILTLIFKACIALAHTPTKWRETKVIFLPKPGKEIYDIPKSYRPISLSNFPLKALERLVVWKMDADLTHTPIHPKQHGFTKGKSTESAISDTADYIEQQLYDDKHCLGLFLDISAAFDSISIHHIKQTLLEHNGDPELVAWYHSYLSARFLEVPLHGESLSLTTATGFPQGGVCSARFWLIAFDEAIRIINSGGIVGNGYADDCSALLGGTHPHNMVEKMQSMLKRLVRWGNSCGLRFNAQKTVAVMFSRSTRVFDRLVRMDGDLIPFSDTVVYLGVTLDKELKWQIHLDNKILKAKSLLLKLASIVYSYWGPKPKLMRWMFTGIVRPMVAYAAMVWAHKIEDDTTTDKLRKLTRMAINTMVKVPRSTPTRGLEIILDILPLHLHIQKEGLASYRRLFSQCPIQWEGVFTNLTNSISHLRYWEYLAQDLNIHDFHVETDECQVIRPASSFSVNTASFTDMEAHQGHVDCNVYTDGSKIDGLVGAGVLVIRNDREIVADRFRLPDCATVFQAELTAIREAAAVLQGLADLSSVKFFVDSQAALKTIQSDFITSKLALQTVVSINAISASRVELVWTKAHIGTAGNERADALAKEGTLLEHPLAIPTPTSNIKRSIKNTFQQKWSREWLEHNEARQTKLYHPHHDTSISNELIQWSRLKLGRYIRAVTGHNNLLYHLHNINNTISPLCRFCLQQNEEFFHLATDCPPLWWERHRISAQEPDRINWSINQIIDFAYLPSINDAFIKPLYPIDNTPHTLASAPSPSPSQDADNPIQMDSDFEQQSDISVMDITSEEDSSEESIAID